MREYRGYEITVNETMGIGEGPYFEIWKDGTLQGGFVKIKMQKKGSKKCIAQPAP